MIQAEPYALREPCKFCGHHLGRIEEQNGQALVYCLACERWLYNAPKRERGLAPSSTRTDGVSPSIRYRVMERAGFRCEFCGADDKPMHVGHLASEKSLRDAFLPPDRIRDFDNLAWLCDECNLGMGADSLPLHDALVFLWRRKAKEA